jgi:integrase
MSPQIRKIGSVWYSDIRINGQRIRKRLSSDKVVANERLLELIREKDHAGRDMAWDRYREKYLAYSAGSKAAGTALRDKAAIGALERFQKPRRLSDVTAELLERWKAARRTEGRGNATINRDLRAVKAMMRRAVIWGYLKSWDGSAVSKLKETRGRLLFYTVPELRRLLEVCRSRLSGYYDWETICLLGARAGLRRGEIYWLSWRDVDLQRRVISVVPKHGWQPKDAEQRHIPIPKDLERRLRKIPRTTEWVIGERPSLSVMSAFFQKISRKAKLAGNIHTLRHTYASHLVQAGVDLYTVAELLGHSDPKITKIYAHLAPRNLDAAVARLPLL